MSSEITLDALTRGMSDDVLGIAIERDTSFREKIGHLLLRSKTFCDALVRMTHLNMALQLIASLASGGTRQVVGRCFSGREAGVDAAVLVILLLFMTTNVVVPAAAMRERLTTFQTLVRLLASVCSEM